MHYSGAKSQRLPLLFRFDGSHFANTLEISVEDKIKRGKPPKRNRYIHYCNWAHALLVMLFLSILGMTISLIKLYGKLTRGSGKGSFYYPTNSTSFLGPLPWLGGGVRFPSQGKGSGNEVEANSTHVPFSLSTPVLIFFSLS